jgi:L-amino acid N-acyltransferase YncA
VSGVRIANEADADAIAAIYEPYVRDTAISFEEVPPTPSEMARRLTSTLEFYPYLVFDDGASVLGYAHGGTHRAKPAYRWSVETTLYVERNAHRRGIGRALYAQLLHLLIQQGFHVAFAGIVPPNEKSVGLHESLGFVYLGTFPEIGFKHGQFHDVGWWRRTLAEGRPRHEPIPFKSIVSSL